MLKARTNRPERASANLPCRQCGAVSLRSLGLIPAADVFAGHRLNPPWDGGVLYQCRQCHLAFRHPIRTEAEYENLYARASGQIWVSDALRTDQKHVLSSIEAACPGGKVLDVGCYDGVLLAALGSQYQRFGVEASAAACDAARKRGVEIVAAKIRDLVALTTRFEVITAVDVIEHVEDPRSFVTLLAERLAPDGTLIISTGTLDSLAWRVAGGLYWYCGFPEHISFITQEWARGAGAALGLDVVDVRRFAYSKPEARSLTRQQWRFYRKAIRAKLREKLASWWPSSAEAPEVPPSARGAPGLFEDHMIVQLKKATRP